MKASFIKIKAFSQSVIPEIVSSFEQHDWPKPIKTFKTHWQEQENNERLVWLAYDNDLFAGYVTLKFQSDYKPFLAFSGLFWIIISPKS